jgi:hypothetical protein
MEKIYQCTKWIRNIYKGKYMKAQCEPLSKLIGLPRNPKLHNLGEIHMSIDRFGFVNRIVINDTTNHLIAGHGRVEALRQKKLLNESAPKGVEVKPDDWYVPTDRIEIPESEEEALAIALNKIGENEWDDDKTAQILADLAAKGELDGTGFDGEDVDYLLKKTAPRPESEYVTDEDLEKYAEEKSHWRWLRLRIMEDTYDRWKDLKARMKKIENDDQMVELLLNLLDDNLVERLT